MAIFRIIASRPPQIKDFSDHPEFDIELISGKLKEGDRFQLFETHHPCNYTILNIKEKDNHHTLVVKESISWENKWADAVVDTENNEVSRRYGYRV